MRKAHPVITYREAAGRTLTIEALRGVTGMFRYKIAGERTDSHVAQRSPIALKRKELQKDPQGANEDTPVYGLLAQFTHNIFQRNETKWHAISTRFRIASGSVPPRTMKGNIVTLVVIVLAVLFWEFAMCMSLGLLCGLPP